MCAKYGETFRFGRRYLHTKDLVNIVTYWNDLVEYVCLVCNVCKKGEKSILSLNFLF